MKLSTASAILCTALLASFCNTFPYPDYWDREAFLDQLQQEERMGTDIEARIEQGDQCPFNHEVVFIYPENAVITPLSLRDPKTDEVIGEQFEYKCELDYILEISHDGEFSFNKPVPPKASIKYECTYKEGSYQSSIDKYGIPRCREQRCPRLLINDIKLTITYGSDPPIRRPGNVATYHCSEGYTLRGEKTRTCGHDGEWSGEEPKCVLQCPELQNITNGLVSISGQEPGDRANYTCIGEYTLQGTSNRTCDQNGQWSGQEPRCVPWCPVLPGIPNGAVSFASRTPGATATYSCRFGYQLNETKERICGLESDGKWSGVEPFCESSVVFCPLDPVISEDTDPIPSPPPVPGPPGTLGYEVGTVITYTCATDFELQGESKRTCLENGTFDHPRPFCFQVKCHALNTSDIPNNDPEVKRELLPYVRIYGNSILYQPYYNRNIEGDRFEGSKAYLTCMPVSKNGWKLQEGTPDVQTCVRRENGELEWTNAGTCVYTYKKINYG